MVGVDSTRTPVGGVALEDGDNVGVLQRNGGACDETEAPLRRYWFLNPLCHTASACAFAMEEFRPQAKEPPFASVEEMKCH